MSFACDELRIGRQTRFREIQALNDFAVYEVEPGDGKPFSIIARRPRTKHAAIGFQPACVTTPFESTEKAIETLSRWANTQASPALPPKPQAPSGRRNGNRAHQQSDAVDQMFLNL